MKYYIRYTCRCVETLQEMRVNLCYDSCRENEQIRRERERERERLKCLYVYIFIYVCICLYTMQTSECADTHCSHMFYKEDEEIPARSPCVHLHSVPSSVLIDPLCRIFSFLYFTHCSYMYFVYMYTLYICTYSCWVSWYIVR